MAQKSLKINSFIIRVEPAAINKFNLFQVVEAVSRDPEKPDGTREVNIAYGVPLKKAIEIISFKETVSDPLVDWAAFLFRQEAKIESLLKKFDAIEKSLYENMK